MRTILDGTRSTYSLLIIYFLTPDTVGFVAFEGRDVNDPSPTFDAVGKA